LTRLWNRGAVLEILEMERGRAKRKGFLLGLILADLDHFKNINDRFGHLTGNRLLRLVAATLKEWCREYDYVARMGGDEFVIVLPGLSGHPLEMRQLEIQHAIQRAAAGLCSAPIVGLSVGRAQFGQDGRTVEDLLAAADRRMFDNKRRNKSAHWTRPESEAPREFIEAY